MIEVEELMTYIYIHVYVHILVRLSRLKLASVNV